MQSRKTAVEVRANISPSHAVITAANWRHEGVWVLPVSCLHKYAPAELRKGSRRGARSLAPSHAAPTVCVQRAPLFLLHGGGAADALARGARERSGAGAGATRPPDSVLRAAEPSTRLAGWLDNPCARSQLFVLSGEQAEWNEHKTELA